MQWLVYIATRLEAAARHNAVRDALIARGFALSYDWTTHGPVWREGADRIRSVAQYETQGVMDADVVVVLLPGGRGTHVELGIALGCGAAVVLVATGPELAPAPGTCAFYHHPMVTVVHSDAEVPDAVVAALARAGKAWWVQPAMGVTADMTVNVSAGTVTLHPAALDEP